MISFGKLNQVNKTYVKTNVTARGQNYEGIKFRRALSEAGKDEAEKEGKEFKAFLEEKFVFSNKLSEKLKLTENGFIEFTDGPRDAEGNLLKVEQVYMVLVNDEHDGCKILKSTSKGAKKSLSIKAPVLTADLIEAGLLDKDKVGNQYLTLVEEERPSDTPEFVIALYKVVVDTEGGAADDEDEVTETAKEEVAVGQGSGRDF